MSRGPDLKPRKQRSDRGVPKDPRNAAIVDQIIKLLVLDTRPGEIKRIMVRTYPDKFKVTRSVEQYIAVARKRVGTVLAQTPEESLAKSVEFWAEKKRTFESNAAGLRRQVAEAEAKLASEKEPAAVRALLRKLKGAKRELQVQLQWSMNAQREIDRLIGNHAPYRVARTTTDGKDVDRPAVDREPLTAEEGLAELQEMLTRAKSRGSVLEIAETNLEN